MRPLTLGPVRIDTVVENAAVPLRFAEFLPDSRPEDIEAAAAWLRPHLADASLTHGLLSFHSYVLRTERCTILVDACIGNDKERGGHPAFHRLNTPWLDELHAIGVAPESIDYVLCTHLHADHVGWNTRLLDGRWVPTFPRARYLFARTEYEHRLAGWRTDPQYALGMFADSILPVVEAGQALIVDDGYELEGLLTLEPAPGHTPGNIVIRLGRLGATNSAVFSGDVIHHPLQVRFPEWSAAFCEDPLRSADCRRQFVMSQAETPTLILPAHFPAPTAGHIRRDGARWRYEFIA